MLLFESLISLILRFRLVVLLTTLGLLAVGLRGLRDLPIDAVPDISPVQIQVLIPTPMLPPEEAETAVTRVLERELGGLPGLEKLRSLTTFGIVQVTALFAQGTDLYRARQTVAERLQIAASLLPTGLTPQLAPLSPGLGEIYTYSLQYAPGPGTPTDEVARLTELKLLQEFTVRPLLRTVPGIADVNTTGGYDKQIVVAVDPVKAHAVGVDLGDIATTLLLNTGVNSGAFFNHGKQLSYLRSAAAPRTVEEIAALPVRMSWGDDVFPLKAVGQVGWDVRPRTGAATVNGEEAVLGIALLLPGENSRLTARLFAEKLAEVQKILPPGVEIRNLYDRAGLVDGVLGTLTQNLLISGLLVLGVLVLMLGHGRAAACVALILPLAFLFGVRVLEHWHLGGNLFSLGAIDIGLMVDGAIVMVDQILLLLHRETRAQGRTLSAAERDRVMVRAASNLAGPVLLGLSMVVLVYCPVFGFSGLEAQLFWPMAIMVIACLSGSALLTIVVVPALAGTFLGGESERSAPRWMTALQEGYGRLLPRCYPHLGWALAALVLALIGSLAIIYFLPKEFTPQLDEGSLVLEIQRAADLNLDESLDMEKRTERALLQKVPEVRTVYARLGFSDLTTDAQLPSENDLYVDLRPRPQWRKRDGRTLTKGELTTLIRGVIDREVPGQNLNASQPIEVRFAEMLEGVKTDLVVKIYGDDYPALESWARQAHDRLAALPGVGEVTVESVVRSEVIEAQPDRNYLQRYAIFSSDFNRAIPAALLGAEAGRLQDGERFYPIVVRLRDKLRKDPESLQQIPMRAQSGFYVSLGQAATLQPRQELSSITREDGRRRLAILIDVPGRDVLGFAREARAALTSLPVPTGDRWTLEGSFQRYERARDQLQWMIPGAVVGLVILAYLALGSWTQALIVVAVVPLAVSGGVFSIWLAGLPFSITAAIGLVAVAGIATLNSLVKVAYINQQRALTPGPLAPIVTAAARERLRPVLTTALVAIAGFLPMALSTHLGAEVQKPLALMIIGGLLSSTFLTLFITPMMYVVWGGREARG